MVAKTGKPRPAEGGHVADAPVDHQPGDAPGLGLGGEHLAPVTELGLTLDLHHEHLARSGAWRWRRGWPGCRPGAHRTGTASPTTAAPGHMGRMRARMARPPDSPRVAAPSRARARAFGVGASARRSRQHLRVERRGRRFAGRARPRCWRRPARPWHRARRWWPTRCGAAAPRCRDGPAPGAAGARPRTRRGRPRRWRPPRSASTSAASSTSAPRAVLTSTAVGFMRASAAASMRWRLSSLSGACRLTKSAVDSSSSSATCGRRSAASASGSAMAVGVRRPACRSRGPARPPRCRWPPGRRSRASLRPRPGRAAGSVPRPATRRSRDQPLALAQAPGRGQQQGEGQVGGGIGQHAGRVGQHHAPGRRRGHVHVVEADGQVGHHPQPAAAASSSSASIRSVNMDSTAPAPGAPASSSSRAPVDPRSAGRPPGRPASVRGPCGREGQWPADEDRLRHPGRALRTRRGGIDERPDPWSPSVGGTGCAGRSGGSAGHDPVRCWRSAAHAQQLPAEGAGLATQPHDAFGRHLARLPRRLVDAGRVGHEALGGHRDVDRGTRWPRSPSPATWRATSTVARSNAALDMP